VANFEIASWFESKFEVQNTVGMNLGGSVQLPFGKVTMTIAFHSSQLPDGAYGGNPGGFLLELDGLRIYVAGDTALFSDMQLIAREPIDVAILPIGDLFTMGPADSVAATQLLKPKNVLPAHYNTWPPIEQDAAEWAEAIRSKTSAEPILAEVGKAIAL
jgi:L-ascorbate metabolism protein UlaG (beta-lactamase superfamily)